MSAKSIVQTKVLHYPGHDLSEVTTQTKIALASLVDHLTNDGSPVLTMAICQDRIIIVSPGINMTRSGAKLQQAAYEREVRSIAKDPAVICMRSFVPLKNKQNDDRAMAVTIQERGFMPVGAVLAFVGNADGTVKTDTIEVLTEPDRRTLFGKLAFLLSKPQPYNPLLPIYVDFGSASEIPASIAAGAIAHAPHETMQ